MVKFSHGCWHPAQDTLIDWAVEVIKSEAREDNLHFVTVRAFPSRIRLETLYFMKGIILLLS